MNWRTIPSSEALGEYIVQHTPGPWYPGQLGGTVCSVHSSRINPASARYEDGEVRSYGGYLVCESAGRSGDVAIMSAAPDMYDLLRKLHDWLAVSATGPQSLAFQKEIQDLFFEVWRMGDRK